MKEKPKQNKSTHQNVLKKCRGNLMLFVLWLYFPFKLIQKLLIELRNKNINTGNPVNAGKWQKALLIRNSHHVPIAQVFLGEMKQKENSILRPVLYQITWELLKNYCVSPHTKQFVQNFQQ